MLLLPAKPPDVCTAPYSNIHMVLHCGIPLNFACAACNGHLTTSFSLAFVVCQPVRSLCSLVFRLFFHSELVQNNPHCLGGYIIPWLNTPTKQENFEDCPPFTLSDLPCSLGTWLVLIWTLISCLGNEVLGGGRTVCSKQAYLVPLFQTLLRGFNMHHMKAIVSHNFLVNSVVYFFVSVIHYSRRWCVEQV